MTADERGIFMCQCGAHLDPDQVVCEFCYAVRDDYIGECPYCSGDGTIGDPPDECPYCRGEGCFEE